MHKLPKKKIYTMMRSISVGLKTEPIWPNSGRSREWKKKLYKRTKNAILREMKIHVVSYHTNLKLFEGKWRPKFGQTILTKLIHAVFSYNFISYSVVKICPFAIDSLLQHLRYGINFIVHFRFAHRNVHFMLGWCAKASNEEEREKWIVSLRKTAVWQRIHRTESRKKNCIK